MFLTYFGNGRLRWLRATLMFILCGVLVGCTVIGEMSWKSLILGKYAVKSSVGTTEISLKFHADPSSFKNASQNEKDTWRRLDALNSSTLKYNRVREDARTMAWTGQLQTRFGTIPIQANIRDGQFAVLMEGSNEPFVLPLYQVVVKNGWLNFPLTFPMQERFNARFDEIIPIVMEFLVDHLADPPSETVSVNPLEVVVNGEAVQVKRILMKMNAQQMNAWMAKGIQAILADVEGQEKLIEQILAILSVPVSTPLAEVKLSEEDRWIVNIIKPMVVSELNKMLVAWKKGNAKNSLHVMWDVDAQLAIRQFESNLVMYPVNPWAGLKGYEVSLKRQSWSIDQPQKADVLSFKPWPNQTMWTEQSWLKTAQKGSVLHQALLKNYQLTRKVITLKSPKLIAAKTTKKSKTNVDPSKVENGVLWSLVKNKTLTHVSQDWIQKNVGTANWNPKTKALTLQGFAMEKPNKLPPKAIVVNGKNVWFELSEVCKATNTEARWFEKQKQWDLLTDTR